MAALIGAAPGEITFTSGATESNNWAIKGLLMPRRARSGQERVVTSAIEHVSVLAPCRTLERAGFEVVTVGVDSDGVIDLDAARAAVNEETALVTMTLASNEIGTIEPIAEVGARSAARLARRCTSTRPTPPASSPSTRPGWGRRS